MAHDQQTQYRLNRVELSDRFAAAMRELQPWVDDESREKAALTIDAAAERLGVPDRYRRQLHQARAIRNDSAHPEVSGPPSPADIERALDLIDSAMPEFRAAIAAAGGGSRRTTSNASSSRSPYVGSSRRDTGANGSAVVDGLVDIIGAMSSSSSKGGGRRRGANAGKNTYWLLLIPFIGPALQWLGLGELLAEWQSVLEGGVGLRLLIAATLVLLPALIGLLMILAGPEAWIGTAIGVVLSVMMARAMLVPRSRRMRTPGGVIGVLIGVIGAAVWINQAVTAHDVASAAIAALPICGLAAFLTWQRPRVARPDE